MSKQRITLNIDCHRLVFPIEAELEPLYRKAARTLNEVYQDYTKKMPNASVEEIWVYVALYVALNLHADIRDKNLEPVLKKIGELNQQIEESLKDSTDNTNKIEEQ